MKENTKHWRAGFVFGRFELHVLRALGIVDSLALGGCLGTRSAFSSAFQPSPSLTEQASPDPLAKSHKMLPIPRSAP